jgi:hypothetical protein
MAPATPTAIPVIWAAPRVEAWAAAVSVDEASGEVEGGVVDADVDVVVDVEKVEGTVATPDGVSSVDGVAVDETTSVDEYIIVDVVFGGAINTPPDPEGETLKVADNGDECMFGNAEIWPEHIW